MDIPQASAGEWIILPFDLLTMTERDQIDSLLIYFPEDFAGSVATVPTGGVAVPGSVNIWLDRLEAERDTTPPPPPIPIP
jgi:hypothetical protein